MKRKTVQFALFAALVGLLAAPATARAQSAIAGVVKDTSGAVLPGVTVEAASDALIEGLRTAITDGSGQYKIVDLRPGQYIVTFTLPGFQTVKRDGIELPSNFTAQVSIDMKIGALEETITVSGQTPTVDVQSAVHTQVLNREAIDAIPTGRTIQGMGQLIVGVNLNLPDTGGARAMQQTYMSTHGMSSANNTVMVDGMMVNGLQGDGAIQMYYNDAMNQEVSYQTSGIGADTSAGGVRLNMIPREGGNRFSGDFKTAYRPGSWQSDNVTTRLQDLGLKAGNATDRIIDFTAAQGGPIREEKLWFFASARYFTVNNFIADTFFDDGSQGVDDQRIKDALLRMTWQITPKHKFSAYFDEVDKFRGHDMQAKYDPETASTVWYSPAYHTASAKFTSTLTSRLLFEAGWSSNLEYYTNSYQPGIGKPGGSAAWYRNTSQVESDLGGRQTATLYQSTQSPSRYSGQGSLSYVTGSHNIKGGVQLTRGRFIHTYDGNGQSYRVYRSNSTGVPFTVPSQIVVTNLPVIAGERLNSDIGVYGQDSWTLRQLTLNLGLRFEHLNAEALSGDVPAGRFVPARHFDAITSVPNWNNWAPRLAAVYDVFGDAKTAVKYSLNRYNQQRTTGIADDYGPLTLRTQALTWRDLNGDDFPDGSISYAADGTRTACVYLTPGCEINFAQLPASFGTRALNTYGEYPRTWNLESGLELQHELMPSLSTTMSWFHGAFHNLTATVNQNLTFADYTPFTVYNPTTGEAITAYNRTAASISRAVDNLDTFDPKRREVYNAFNFEFRARPGRGAQFFGGLSVERERQTNCTAPDNPNSQILCDDFALDIPWRKNFKLAGSYTLPYGIQISGALQSNASPSASSSTTTRNMVFTRTTRYPASCPSPCPAGQTVFSGLTTSSLTVPLLSPRASFVERITQLDLKAAKTFKVGRVSVQPQVEAFNLNNSDAIISYLSVNTLSASYEHPNSVMQGRMVGVGAQVRW
jgi:Carboxypeptidase regulatory-like domain